MNLLYDTSFFSMGFQQEHQIIFPLDVNRKKKKKV